MLNFIVCNDCCKAYSSRFGFLPDLVVLTTPRPIRSSWAPNLTYCKNRIKCSKNKGIFDSIISDRHVPLRVHPCCRICRISCASLERHEEVQVGRVEQNLPNFAATSRIVYRALEAIPIAHTNHGVLRTTSYQEAKLIILQACTSRNREVARNSLHAQTSGCMLRRLRGEVQRCDYEISRKQDH
jgi:hypothetical protein